MIFDGFFWLASLAALLVGLAKGGLPTIGMVAVPVLSLVMSPVKAAVMLLPIYVISDMVSVWLYRKHFSLPNLKILVPASILGVFIGWLTASMTSDTAVKLLIGVIGIAFCLNIWLRRTPQAIQGVDLKKGVFWGVITGFTSFICHAGAPPFQMYVLPQRLPKVEFAGTATMLFTIVNLAKVLPYQQLNPYTSADLIQAMWLIPSALIGTFAGAYLTRRIADIWFFRFVQFGLFAISVKLIVDALWP
jgi:uncharacterized protein